MIGPPPPQITYFAQSVGWELNTGLPGLHKGAGEVATVGAAVASVTAVAGPLGADVPCEFPEEPRKNK